MPKTKNPMTPKQGGFIEEYAIDDATTPPSGPGSPSGRRIRSAMRCRQADNRGRDRRGAGKLAKKAEVTAERVIAELAAIGFLTRRSSTTRPATSYRSTNAGRSTSRNYRN